MNLTPKQIYSRSYVLKVTNTTLSKGDICDLLKLDKKDLNVTHRVALGILKANQKLGLKKGYSIK